MSEPLRIALTKGRLQDKSVELFEAMGLDGSPIRNPGRRLIHSIPNYPLDAVLANEIAPEHLEIMTADPRALLPAIRNAGAVFLGAWSPEPLGDYLAGPDHVLPTSGTARLFSPLSVDSFLKTMSVIQYDRASLAPIAGQIVTLAESEHLTAHANSIRVRFE